MASQDSRTWGSSAGGTVVSATGSATAGAPGSATRLDGREPQAPCREITETIPSIGPIRAALLVALLQTPHRFRTKRQLWAYSGFAVETHDSGEYRVVKGKLRRNRKRITMRRLNPNHNHDLKNLFKGAALSASTRPGPLCDFMWLSSRKGYGRRCRVSPWHERWPPLH